MYFGLKGCKRERDDDLSDCLHFSPKPPSKMMMCSKCETDQKLNSTQIYKSKNRAGRKRTNHKIKIVPPNSAVI